MPRITLIRVVCLLLLILSGSWLTPFSAYSQPTKIAKATVDTEQRCLSVRQLVKISDSLAMLPRLRLEITYWYRASLLDQAENGQLRASLRTQAAAEIDQNFLLANEQQKTAVFRHKAHKRGLLNWLLIAGASLFTTHKLTH